MIKYHFLNETDLGSTLNFTAKCLPDFGQIIYPSPFEQGLRSLMCEPEMTITRF